MDCKEASENIAHDGARDRSAYMLIVTVGVVSRLILAEDGGVNLTLASLVGELLNRQPVPFASLLGYVVLPNIA